MISRSSCSTMIPKPNLTRFSCVTRIYQSRERKTFFSAISFHVYTFLNRSCWLGKLAFCFFVFCLFLTSFRHSRKQFQTSFDQNNFFLANKKWFQQTLEMTTRWKKSVRSFYFIKSKNSFHCSFYNYILAQALYK